MTNRLTCRLLLAAAFFSIALPPASADSLLETAIRSRDVAQLTTVLDRGADPDEVFPVFGMSALMLAAIHGRADMVDLLLERGADPNWAHERVYSALSAAVRSCASGWNVVERLLAAGADIDNRSGDSLTPLMVSIQEERPTFFWNLLEHGADINAVNAYGEGSLNYAIYYGRPDYIAALLDRGVDTGPMRLLFTTGEKYYPNFGAARPHAVDCAR